LSSLSKYYTLFVSGPLSNCLAERRGLGSTTSGKSSPFIGVVGRLEACLGFYQHVAAAGRPRYLHVFYSDKSNCLGDLQQWAGAPKYGGVTGLEELEVVSESSA
jgi:hypothetical protein